MLAAAPDSGNAGRVAMIGSFRGFTVDWLAADGEPRALVVDVTPEF